MNDDLLVQWMAAGGLFLFILMMVLALKSKRLRLGFSLSGAGTGAAPIQLLGRRSLTGQHAVFAVEIDGQKFLIVTSPAASAVQPLPSAFSRELETSLRKGEA
jgi:flagellar biogenesis protein FliO